jgi:Na+/citrate or Na+/malate symporter
MDKFENLLDGMPWLQKNWSRVKRALIASFMVVLCLVIYYFRDVIFQWRPLAMYEIFAVLVYLWRWIVTGRGGDSLSVWLTVAFGGPALIILLGAAGLVLYFVFSVAIGTWPGLRG